MAKAGSKSVRGRIRSQRLETRVTAEQKFLIERVAALEGRTVTDFVLTSAQDAPRRAIAECQQLDLSVRASKALSRPCSIRSPLMTACATRYDAIAD